MTAIKKKENKILQIKISYDKYLQTWTKVSIAVSVTVCGNVSVSVSVCCSISLACVYAIVVGAYCGY